MESRFDDTMVKIYPDHILFTGADWVKAECFGSDQGTNYSFDNTELLKVGIESQYVRKGAIEDIIFHDIDENSKFIAVFYHQLDELPGYCEHLDIYKLERITDDDEM